MGTVIDRLYRLAYRIAYPIAIVTFRVFRVRLVGVFVFIWYGDRFLLVKNSYRHLYSLPGGLINRGETPLAAAIRESREEVGIQLQADQLRPAHFLCDSYQGTAHLYEIHLAEQPCVTIDRREIVWADFVTVPEALTRPLNTEIKLYLASLTTPAGAEASP